MSQLITRFSLDMIAKEAKVVGLTHLFSTYTTFTIEDTQFTPGTIITGYSEKIPYISPNDGDYNNRPWELTPRDLTLIILAYNANIDKKE